MCTIGAWATIVGGCHLARLSHTNIVGFRSHFLEKLDKNAKLFFLKEMKITSTEYSQEGLVGYGNPSQEPASLDRIFSSQERLEGS